MFALLKRLAGPKAAPEHRDNVLGLLVSKTEGEWRGEVPFHNYHVKILLPGATYQPSSSRLAFARTLLPNLDAKVNQALDYAAAVNPDLWRGRRMFSVVNFFYQTTGDSFALDFVLPGDRSGKFWQVRFEGGQPVHLEYC
jgi:hypothetical protein